MNVELNEAQRMIRDSATDWLAANCMPPLGTQTSSRSGESHWRAFAEMGWLGLPFSEEDGGFAGGSLELGVLMHALGERLVTLPYVTSVAMAGELVAKLASVEQRRQLLPALMKGDVRLALAHSEPLAEWPWDPRNLRALRAGECWTLNGDKSMVDVGHDPTHWVVTARCDDGRPCVFLVSLDGTSDEVDHVEYETLSGGRACDLRFRGLRVPLDALLGQRHESHASILEEVLAAGVIAQCWGACGVMDMLLAQTSDYVRQRKQFGQPLSNFQAVQHKLAEMGIECMEARAACELASMRADRSDAVFPLAAAAKTRVARAADLVGKEAIQLHGAMGVCNEMPVAQAFRWLQAFGLEIGRSSAHAEALGKHQMQDRSFAHSAVWECLA